MSQPQIVSVSANESSKRVDLKFKLTATATHVLHLTSSQARSLSGLLSQAADDVAPKPKPAPKPAKGKAK